MKIIFSIITLLCSAGLSAQSEVKWKAVAEHISGDSYRVVFTADIAPGWHMYDMGPYEGMGPNATVFTVAAGSGFNLQGKVAPLDKPVRKYDEMFAMEIGYFEGKARFSQNVKLSAAKATLKATVEWMVCDDKSCMPPEEHEFSVEIVAAHDIAPEKPLGDSGEAAAASASGDEQAGGQSTSRDSTFRTEGDSGSSVGEITVAGVSGGGDSLWGLILLAIGAGFAALLTPCIFPMVPMTVSFFMKGSRTPAHGRFRASMYGLFIVVLYTVPIAVLMLITRFAGGETVTDDIFNWIATHWLPNVLFFVIFMVFAASFFGAFEITLPSRLITKSDSNSDRGGLGGVFFMALTLVLISFSCTIPIVALVIRQSLEGEFWRPILTIFAFSVTFALPFTLFAFFPMWLEKLPKSGGWLNSVKVVLGFIEVALGLKFLSVADQTYHWGILDREVYLAIWIVVFSLMGAYLMGKIRFKHDSEVKHIGVGRLALIIATFSFVVYLIPGMFGAPLKALSGYMPPMHTQDFVIGQSSSASAGAIMVTDPANGERRAPKYSDMLHLPHGLAGFFDLEEAQHYANETGKPLFVDITGHGCVNCREMEARVWSDPQVLDILRNQYVIVALYADDKTTLPQSEWIATENGKVLKGLGKINAYLALKHFGRNAQPYYILVGRDGKPLVPARGYDLNVHGFVEFLRSGVEAYRAELNY